MHKLNVYSTTQSSISKCQISYGKRSCSHMEGEWSTTHLSDVAFHYPPRTNMYNHHLSGDGLKAEFPSWCDYHEGERQGKEGHKKGARGGKPNEVLQRHQFPASSKHIFVLSFQEIPVLQERISRETFAAEQPKAVWRMFCMPKQMILILCCRKKVRIWL